ncbi:Holliday junction branch migration protein RuvA [Cytobacillus sp. FSL W7-1323]|uniref:Holliday junction branch migration complex subunit RuvA n=1 Tax=Cytobacillus kochii TaxID=859143 RepID=A0A248TKY3_9BACI|nr:Holliday junction branch migration protein RuvA [Cytobacillus kochii]ASV68866.1 Holliday junction branch migration protein RuvA [Cytobacillus kochii]MDQ0183579.1 Holliday junction DNA helicase RuvA [Cytobacillus kochii]
MFEYIIGRVDFIGPEYIVVENNGIGYQVITPNPFRYTTDQEVKIYTYHHVREDIESLYGFTSRQEKALFMKLLNVTGIGPKGALAVLATGQPEAVVHAIEHEDEAFLVKFPGVGKKTARQMILDLKGKLVDIVPDLLPNLFTEEKQIKSNRNHELDEALLALKALGYSDKELKKITKDLSAETLTTDQYIKLALQKLLK